jgi:ATP-dependent DNA helicase PIF1
MTEPTPPAEIDLNPAFLKALALMEDTRRHVFVTGRAGTGKSTLLTHFRRTTRKNVVVLAPTGVAAVNIGGQTIHSFFGFKPDVTPGGIRRKGKDEKKNLYRILTTIVIDEVSMVRADLLDCVDKFLRLNGPDGTRPFGGVQMILIGDLYQLPPVVTGEQKTVFRTHYSTPYFFSARAMEELDIALVELEQVYRQTDDEFIRLLNTIRNRTATDADIAALNRRCDPAFEPPAKDCCIHLTSTNALADGVNAARLARLKGKLWISRGVIEGDFGAEYLPTAVELKLKRGAQIMLLNNDAAGRWINGTIARVTGFVTDADGQELIAADLETGNPVSIAPYTWEIYRFFLKDGELASESAGSFTHFPVRLAFAVTIHKSQGKTFEKALIDVGRGTFAHGQMYVALSRCRSLAGIVLRQPLKRSHLLLDWQVVKFLTRFQYAQAEGLCPREEKIRIIAAAIANRQTIEIVYLKAKDEKSRRSIRPLTIGNMDYNGRSFLGLQAFCLTRRESRTFNVDRILEISASPAPLPPKTGKRADRSKAAEDKAGTVKACKLR